MLPDALRTVINELKRLPGIGPKSAERLAFFMLRKHKSNVRSLGDAILRLANGISMCDACFNVSEKSPCKICDNPSRERGIICVVEEPTDALAIENTHQYKGLYHVLHGRISPLDNMSPDELRLGELVERVRSYKKEGGDGASLEIILAMNPDMEGETTALYIAKQLATFDVKITRIARGLPVGSDLEYADQMTLTRALEGRQGM